VIAVRSIHKRFGRVHAVDDVSFDVAAGESLALWGHNGAGKTTILRCLLDAIPFDGSISIDGCDVRRDGREARSRVGFVPQDVRFYDHLTTRETLTLFRRIRRTHAARARELIEQMALEPYAAKRVRELSGGIRQRLALAVALLSNPPVLLLDEPTSNLDEESRSEFFSFLARQKKSGTTIVFSSHRGEEVTALGDRALVLENGRIVSQCAADQLPATHATAGTLRVHVDPERVPEALAVLTSGGFAAAHNGGGVRVRVQQNQKVRPIEALIRAGIPVLDFDLLSRTEEKSS